MGDKPVLAKERNITDLTVSLNRFTGSYEHVLGTNSPQPAEIITVMDATDQHEAELFLQINIDLHRNRTNSAILVTNCDKRPATDLCRWGGSHKQISRYCETNCSAALTRPS